MEVEVEEALHVVVTALPVAAIVEAVAFEAEAEVTRHTKIPRFHSRSKGKGLGDQGFIKDALLVKMRTRGVAAPVKPYLPAAKGGAVGRCSHLSLLLDFRVPRGRSFQHLTR